MRHAIFFTKTNHGFPRILGILQSLSIRHRLSLIHPYTRAMFDAYALDGVFALLESIVLDMSEDCNLGSRICGMLWQAYIRIYCAHLLRGRPHSMRAIQVALQHVIHLHYGQFLERGFLHPLTPTSFFFSGACDMKFLAVVPFLVVLIDPNCFTIYSIDLVFLCFGWLFDYALFCLSLMCAWLVRGLGNFVRHGFKSRLKGGSMCLFCFPAVAYFCRLGSFYPFLFL
ncbi:uncharacterized protein BP01DRAFT_50413 [Aspergillus saccharolyticus JOP 1030-1]|uniref:Uncharacterized protein n=1 Tax=Aspergillus saccharolyticus JOP 1030-1 TaxID=1450539 RepID=A0A318ZD06_9EURO|nr:hypothetical protein BP01DRAFT_50413 [Aspergillus saccharolyticus JOP 1030-1]PYH45381.1 hypothetical protein BP01DRAFT_50413 [Aspergillus saccharolyticus JOP 1030-1]